MKNYSPLLAIEIKVSSGYKIICASNISFIEASRKFSTIHFKDCSNIISFNSLKWFNQILLEPTFVRCHNSYIVNCRFVDSYNHRIVVLKDKSVIPISKAKFSTLIACLKVIVIFDLYPTSS